MRHATSLSLMILSPLAACTAAELAPGAIDETEAGIIDGTIDTEDPSVVYIRSSFAACTGTLISSKIILTAGHCVSPTPTSAVFGRVAASGVPVTIKDAYAHPDYTEDDFSYADIGVAILEKRATVEPSRPGFVPMDATTVGATVRLVGFGWQEIGPAGGIGEKMQVDVQVHEVWDRVFTYWQGTCSGDSGGPAFQVQPDGLEAVVGVTSFGYTDDCSGWSGSTRVDLYQSWLEGVIAAEDPPSCERDYRCMSGCPEPDLDCPCAEDGFCIEECPDTDSDPDCPVGCGENGVCVETGCPAWDLDCGDPCDDNGLCATDCAVRDPDCPAPLALGETCTTDFDCQEPARCLQNGADRVCTAVCTVGGTDCAAGTTCEPVLPGVAVCQPVEGGDDGGCAVSGPVGGAGAGGAGSALLVLAVLVARPRRKPGTIRACSTDAWRSR